jgi:hypothetical protein
MFFVDPSLSQFSVWCCNTPSVCICLVHNALFVCMCSVCNALYIYMFFVRNSCSVRQIRICICSVCHALLSVWLVIISSFCKSQTGGFFYVFIQHWFICRPSDSTVSEDAGIDPRTVATLTLAVRRSSRSARSHPH